MTVTQIVMASATVLLLGYDVYAAIKGGVSNTISWQFYDLAKKYPILPFALGYLCGHLTFPI